MNEPVISIQSLSKSFQGNAVLEDVNLEVLRGETFAFLGRNGAGKTTTIRMMLGLLEPDSGQTRVAGLDPMTDALEIRRRIGYLAEDQQMFGWMTVAETMRFTKPFFPTWDDTLAAKLLQDFDLSATAKVKTLSKGQNVRLGLLLALAHRPEVVILDDPTLGLDPIMRREFMRNVIEHLQGEGATVFFSSHLLYEIEPIADQVAILDRGRIVRQAQTEALRDEVKQFLLSAEDCKKAADIPGVLDMKPAERRTAIIVKDAQKARDHLQEKAIDFEQTDLNLDEIFEAYVIGSERGGLK